MQRVEIRAMELDHPTEGRVIVYEAWFLSEDAPPRRGSDWSTDRDREALAERCRQRGFEVVD